MAKINPRDFSASGQQAPASYAAAITPTDTADDNLPTFTRSIYIGGAGDLAVEFNDGTTFTFKNLLAGQVYPFRVAQVLATGTTATELAGLY